jgi:group I intron endonuclease
MVSITAESVYKNLVEKSTLVSIKNDLTNVGGIYAIVHEETNKLYVGSSMNLAKRIMEHLNDRSSNIVLQRAISKYGLSQFSAYILEILPTTEDLTDIELSITLVKMEQYYLDLFNDKYNINPQAGKTRLGAKHSEATKELMSKLRKGNSINRTFSPEDIAEMSERNKGANNPMFGVPVSDSNKKLISEMFRKPIYLYDANNLTLIASHDRYKDLIDALGISPKTLIKYRDSGEVFRDKYIISSEKLDT